MPIAISAGTSRRHDARRRWLHGGGENPRIPGTFRCGARDALLGDAAGAAARCRELHVAGYLMKPVSQPELLDGILTALGGKPKWEPERGTTEISSVASGWRILLAEDNVVTRAVAAAILGKYGHSVVHAANGREAVEGRRTRSVVTPRSQP